MLLKEVVAGARKAAAGCKAQRARIGPKLFIVLIIVSVLTSVRSAGSSNCENSIYLFVALGVFYAGGHQSDAASVSDGEY